MTKPTIQTILAVAIVLSYIAYLFVLDKDNQALQALATLVVGYYFGSSAGSARKTDLMNK
jgi:hypothetical protein